MSEWKEQAAKRRDIRHDSSQPTEERVGQRPRKNTRKWCKGKVGVEHVFVEREIRLMWMPYTYIEKRCSNCDKRMPYKRSKGH